MELYLIIGLGVIQLIVIVLTSKKIQQNAELLQVLNQLYKERFKMIQAVKKFGLFSTTERDAWGSEIRRIYPHRSKKEVNDFLNENYKDFDNVKPL